ncbi:MAG: hypothetical protein ABI611_11405 [Solirubrobacteraceae bacterium]
MAPLQPVFPIATRLWKSAKVSEMGVRVSGADFVRIRLEPASGVTTVCEALWSAVTATRSELLARRSRIAPASQDRDLLTEKRAALRLEFQRISAEVLDAIAAEDQVPPQWQPSIETNAAYYRDGRP